MIANPRIFRWPAGLIAAGVTGLGVVVLIAGSHDINALRNVLPGLTSMKPNAALCIAALGSSLIMIVLRPPNKAAVATARILSGAASVLALLTICEYVFGWNLGIDQAIFRDAADTAFAGRMGLNTAAAIMFLGAAIISIAADSEAVVLRGQWLAIGTAVIPFFGIVGYLFSAHALYQIVSSTPMALQTAVALLALCGAALWAKPDRGFMAAVHGDDASGLMLRRMIPAVTIAPIVLGWILLEGERAGFYDTTFGLALMVTFTIMIFGALIVANARGVSRIDAARERAHTDLQAAFESIELRVDQRTRELSEALSALNDNKRRFELAMQASDSGILDLDLATKKLYCSRRWFEMLGRSETNEPQSGADFLKLVHADDRENAMKMLVGHYEGQSEDFSVDVRMLHADGTYRWMLSRGMAVRDASGKAVRMLGSQTDITELKRLQEALRNESIRDGLSGLYNRKHFADRLSSAVQAATRHGRPLSLCMCDLDGLKQINDSFGHQAGDNVIRSLSSAITAEIRNEDVAARYGGDEFCIMLSETGAIYAAACLERIRARVESMLFFTPDDRRYSVTASFGVSDLSGRSSSQLIEAADQALYEAKRRGGNRIVVEEPTSTSRTA